MTSTDMTSHDIFLAIYNNIKTEIPFDAQWRNGTGYFNGATRVDVAPGEYAKSFCPYSERRIILIGTRVGTIVVFERYSEGERGIIVTNDPSPFLSAMGLIAPGSQDPEHLLQMFNIFGGKGRLSKDEPGYFAISYKIDLMFKLVDAARAKTSQSNNIAA